MAGLPSHLLLLVVVIATMTTSIAESRAIPAEPVSLMMDSYGNPVLFLREKRTPVAPPYPHRAMMFTGYYRPVRRTGNAGGQATGVFAQGNAVSGEAFFGGMHSTRLKGGPEPIEEPEISSAEAQAAPEPIDAFAENEETPLNQANDYRPEEHHHQPEEPQPPQDLDRHDQRYPQQGSQDLEPIPEAPVTQSAEEPIALSTETPVHRPKATTGKKHKKISVQIENNNNNNKRKNGGNSESQSDEDEDDADEAEDDDDDEEPAVPFVPFKSNRRRQDYPHLNNFFPMVFSFPGAASRAGSSGSSPPGAVTAIANSYSTGKGGVASSVATAYGGSPNGKKRRTTPAEE